MPGAAPCAPASTRSIAPDGLRPPLLGALCGGLLAGIAIVAGLGAGPNAHPALRAIDGDTLALGEHRIRIADIDAPEPNGSCPAERALARVATARLAALLDAGPIELHRADRDADRYGRKLRIVSRDGRNLGETLVAEGLARPWNGRRARWCFPVSRAAR